MRSLLFSQRARLTNRSIKVDKEREPTDKSADEPCLLFSGEAQESPTRLEQVDGTGQVPYPAISLVISRLALGNGL